LKWIFETCRVELITLLSFFFMMIAADGHVLSLPKQHSRSGGRSGEKKKKGDNSKCVERRG